MKTKDLQRLTRVHKVYINPKNKNFSVKIEQFSTQNPTVIMNFGLTPNGLTKKTRWEICDNLAHANKIFHIWKTWLVKQANAQ